MGAADAGALCRDPVSHAGASKRQDARRFSWLALCLAALAAGCHDGPRAPAPHGEALASPEGSIRFEQLAEASGIDFRLTQGDPSLLNLLQVSAGGAGLLDYDGDGDLDVLLLGLSRCALYANDGRGHFRDVTAQSGLSTAGAWMGCATGDFDNDGRTDLFVSGYRCARLYRNRGGRFEDVTRASGIRQDRWFTSAGFADVDKDGDLDVYVGAYVQFGPDEEQQCPLGVDPAGQVISGPCGPERYRPQVGTLYLNLGNGRFRDVTRASGLSLAAGKTLGVAFADFDQDGKTDLYLANDRMRCDLFRNQGFSGGVPRFSNVGVASGTAYSRDGHAQSGMGTDWGDADNDGRLDLFVATFQDESKCLYVNQGRGQFVDSSLAAGLAPADPYVTFGARLVDLDNDGSLDLVVANGHVFAPIGRVDRRLSYPQPLQVFRNRGDGTFDDVSGTAGPVFQVPIVGRAVASGDLDNDGRTDVVAVDLLHGAVVLKNETATPNHWLRVRLRGTKSNRDGIGALVRVRAGGREQVRQVTTCSSYLSASDPRLLFGLGPAETIDRVSVRWPSGRVSTLSAVKADREITIVEDGDVGGEHDGNRHRKQS